MQALCKKFRVGLMFFVSLSFAFSAEVLLSMSKRHATINKQCC
jgi:hypothetical protein